MRSKSSLLSYSLYDAGETVLGALLFSTLYPLYITEHVDPKLYSFLYGFSFLLSFGVALYLGKWADQKGGRKLLFSLFSLLVVLLCALLWLTYATPEVNFTLYLLLAVVHQQAMVFYNSLLYNFDIRGTASGLGVAFGYIGSALSLILLAPRLSLPEAFLWIGSLFMLLSLPALLNLKEPKPLGRVDLRRVFSDRAFLFVVLSFLCLSEVAHTLIAMMGVYLKKVYGLQNLEIYRVIGISALGGVLGGVVFGRLTDRLSAGKLFPLGFLLWSFFILLLYFTPKDMLLALGFLAGLSLSHLWTTSRVLILERFAKEDIAVRMSFLSLGERIASTLGLFSWSAFLLLTQDDYRLSALLMLLFPAVGASLYWLSRGYYTPGLR